MDFPKRFLGSLGNSLIHLFKSTIFEYSSSVESLSVYTVDFCLLFLVLGVCGLARILPLPDSTESLITLCLLALRVAYTLEFLWLDGKLVSLLSTELFLSLLSLSCRRSSLLNKSFSLWILFDLLPLLCLLLMLSTEPTEHVLAEILSKLSKDWVNLGICTASS